MTSAHQARILELILKEKSSLKKSRKGQFWPLDKGIFTAHETSKGLSKPKKTA